MQQTMSLSAGAIDGFLNLFGGGVGGLHGIEDVTASIVETDGKVGFHFATAAETPHGSADFLDEIEFERTVGGEFGLERIGEFGIVVFFSGSNEVADSEKAVSDGVLEEAALPASVRGPPLGLVSAAIGDGDDIVVSPFMGCSRTQN